MIDRDIIPKEQYGRLLVQANNRGEVTSAQVIDNSLLAHWVEVGLLPPECIEYSRTLTQWRTQCFRFLDAKTASYGNALGDNGDYGEPFTELVRLIDKRELQQVDEFLKARKCDSSYFWADRHYTQRAFTSLINLIDSIRQS